MAITWTQPTFPLDQFRRDIMVVGLGTVHKKAYTDTAAATDAVIASQIVRVWSSTDCHIKFGSSPTATTSDVPLTAKSVEYLLVPEPGVSKLSAVRQANSGDIYVMECL